MSINHITLDKYSLAIKGFFDQFLRRNRFSEHVHICRLDQSVALRHIVYAIGSLQLMSDSPEQSQLATNEAIQAYRRSCSTLRSQLEMLSVAESIATIQTTILMGMFELMHASDAVGWRRHYLFGTRELIQSLGPLACRSGAAKIMLLDVRVLETISTILYASRSFLATSPWLETMQFIWENQERGVKDTLLDLATLCGDHCLRSAEYIRSLPEDIPPEALTTLTNYAEGATSFRLQFEAWKLEAQLSTLSPLDNIVTWSVYHTFAIYLHTTFAAIPRWTELGIPVPSLKPHVVDMHLDSLLDVASDALEQRDICPIFLLLPLYVAAIAVRNVEKGSMIRELLNRVRDRYCVVVKETMQVLPFWTPNDSFHGKDTGNSLLKFRRKNVLKHLQIEPNESINMDF